MTQAITMIEEFTASGTVGQVTFRSSASVSIRRSAIFGDCCQR